MTRAVFLLPLLFLAACQEDLPTRADATAPVQASPRAVEAVHVTEERLRARLRAEGALTQRAVQTHVQALDDTMAVCGHVSPTGRGDTAFIPFVSVVGFEGDRAARGELFLAASSQEATRTYFELVDRCFAGGGPQHARSLGRPLPPAPDGLPATREDMTPRAALTPPAAATPAQPGVTLVSTATPAPQAALGTVTVSQRSAANVRSSPSGGGEVLRTAPRGLSLQVFGQAPGGWFQVGDTEAWGWVHHSVLEPR